MRSGPPQRPLGWQFEVGGALLVNPEYQGASRYRVLPVPYVDARYLDQRGVRHFFSVPEGLGTNLWRPGNQRRGATLSVAIAPGFANRDPDNIDGLDTFGPAAEGRVRLSLQSGALGMNLTFADAFSSGHGGRYLDLGLSWRTRIGRQGFLSLGPSLRFGDRDYTDALYGVTPEESQRTGLAAFEAGSGLENIGLGAVLRLPVSRHWRLTTVGRFSRLLEDAKDSSLTATPSQAFFLVALTRAL